MSAKFVRFVMWLRRPYLKFCAYVDAQQPESKEDLEWWSTK